MVDYLHNDPDFKDLLAIVAEKEGIDSTLVEKDYWIMHVLHGLQRLGIEFELKGGTSLSKGYGLIERFSEDIDIHIRTDFGLQIEGNADKPKIREARRAFYDRLVDEIKIPGIIDAVRDTALDDTDKFRSGGIRLHYLSHTPVLEGVKEGILLEVGFDTITPNQPADISSWTLDYVRSTTGLSNYVDNSANGVLCYHPGYTLVEKLQTIVNKYRKEMESEDKPKNFMRQYYDVHCLLKTPEVRRFIGSGAYQAHKIARFRGADKEVPLSEHPALLLPDKNIRESFEARYKNSSKLYYRNQPEFSEILATIQENINLF